MVGDTIAVMVGGAFWITVAFGSVVAVAVAVGSVVVVAGSRRMGTWLSPSILLRG